MPLETPSTDIFLNPNPAPLEEGTPCSCDDNLKRLKELERAHDAVARYISDFVTAINIILYDLTNRVETLEHNCGGR